MSWTETEAIYTELGNGYTVLRPAFVFEFYVDASFNPHARKLIERIRGVFPPRLDVLLHQQEWAFVPGAEAAIVDAPAQHARPARRGVAVLHDEGRAPTSM